MSTQQALIWGASGGIGSALTTLLAESGWIVYAAARNASSVPTGATLTLTFDADYEHSFESAVMRVAQETSSLNLVVYAVGDMVHEKLDSLGLANWEKVVRSNLTGAYLAASHTLPLMAEDGCMVFIGAYLDHLRLPKMGAYAAAKAGLAELATVLQKENRRKRIILVRPGATRTGFWDKVSLRLPADTKEPLEVASAIMGAVQSNHAGDLNL